MHATRLNYNLKSFLSTGLLNRTDKDYNQEVFGVVYLRQILA